MCVRWLVMVLVSFGGHYYGVVIGQLIVETWPDRLKNKSKINMKSCIIVFFFLGEVNALFRNGRKQITRKFCFKLRIYLIHPPYLKSRNDFFG